MKIYSNSGIQDFNAMNQEIKELLTKLDNWKENFNIKEFDARSHRGDISYIATMLRKKNIDGLLTFWDKKLDEDYFELSNPEYPEIVSRNKGSGIKF